MHQHERKRIKEKYSVGLYSLAHELAHAYLHYDKGELVNIDEKNMAPYEEQADRAVRMLLDVLGQ